MKTVYSGKVGSISVDAVFRRNVVVDLEWQGIEEEMAAELLTSADSVDETTKQSVADILLNTGLGKSFTLISKETNIGVTGIIAFSGKDYITAEIIRVFKNAIFIEKTFSA